MIKFYTGCIYVNKSHQCYGEQYIRITKRTDSSVWVEFLPTLGNPWVSDFFKVKRVKIDCSRDCEYIIDNDLGYYFLADSYISQEEFDAKRAQVLAIHEASEKREQLKRDKKVASLVAVLKEHNLTMDTVDFILDTFGGVSSRVLDGVRVAVEKE